jgi:hypothetical protein
VTLVTIFVTMYDTTSLTVPRELCPGTDFTRITPQYLDKVTGQGINQLGEYIHGYIGNMFVSVTDMRVKIQNSFSRYYLGDNFKTLSKGDTRQAIEKISDTLHLPFNEATVTRIDIGHNLVMHDSPSVYLPYLGIIAYYNRLEQPGGLYYNNAKRQLVFYDKISEQIFKKQPIPDIYQGRNLLRYELRFKKQIRAQLRENRITGAMLYDEGFYHKLVKRWRDEYLCIGKINSKIATMKPTGSQKEFIENLALFSILELGQTQVLNKVQEWQESGQITKEQAHRHRSAVKKICETPIDAGGNDLINELSMKIREVSRNW